MYYFIQLLEKVTVLCSVHNVCFIDVCFQLSETCLPVHENVRRKIEDLFAAGVRRVSEYQTLLQDYIKNDLFGGQPAPPLSDARFWPPNRYILGCISCLSSKARFAVSHSGTITLQSE